MRQTIHATPLQVKTLLAKRGITYGDVARVSGVSWSMVYMVVTGRKTSAPVLATISRLVGQPIGKVVA